MITELGEGSVEICEYGCNKLAKFILNNGKFCCENHYNKCEFQKEKQVNKQKGRKLSKERSKQIKEYVITRMKNESKEERKKYGSKKRTIFSILKLCPEFFEYEEIKELEKLFYGRCSNPNCHHSKEKNGWFILSGRKIEERIEAINKQKYHCDKFYCSEKCKNEDPNRKKFISELRLNYYKNLPEEERRIKFLYPRKITIEQIKTRYPIFYNEEEIRYKPGEEYKRIIQGRCKNPNCVHSVEKDGWFDLNRRQLESRISALENPKVTANLYFYCCKSCRVEDRLFYKYKILDLQNNIDFLKYTKDVWRLTYFSVKNNYDKIYNIELRGMKYEYDLDHKYSIAAGFINNIDPKIISNYHNFEIMSHTKNKSKYIKCSISLEKLLHDFYMEEIKKHEINIQIDKLEEFINFNILTKQNKLKTSSVIEELLDEIKKIQ